MSKIKHYWYSFMFPEIDARPLGVLRIGICFVLLCQAMLIAPELQELYGPSGLMQGELNRFLIQKGVPLQLDLNLLAQSLNLSPTNLLTGIFLAYVFSLCCLMIGFKARLFAALACLGHLFIKFNQGQISTYGVDAFAQIFLFYAAVFPFGAAFGIDAKNNKATHWFNGFALRTMQVHMGIAYFSSGVAKAVGWQWQTGEVLWRALNLPQFSVFDTTWLAEFGFVLAILAWGTLVLEIGYPLFMSWSKSRLICALGIIGLHLGIAVTLGLLSFSAFMMVLTGSLFLAPEVLKRLDLSSSKAHT